MTAFINIILLSQITICVILPNATQFGIGQIIIKEDLLPFAPQSSQINPTDWVLRIDGAVQRPMNFTYAELKALPMISVFAELICVDGYFVTAGNWTGVQLSYLLTLVEVLPEAVDMVFYAVDGFSSSLHVSEIRNYPDRLLAYEKDGRLLTHNEGFPVIVVVPGREGYKWVKWVEHIELVDYDHLGTYERAGYPDVTPNSESRRVFAILVVILVLVLVVVAYDLKRS